MIFGLILACFGAIFNVLTDASRKMVLDHQYDATLISFWCKVVAFVCYMLLASGLVIKGVPLELPTMGASLGLTPKAGFMVYLALIAILEGAAILLNLRALQLAPLSLCVPFMALTPLFLLPIGAIFLGETISSGMVIGVLMVVIGSLVIYRKMFALGWLEPVRAIFRERGSRYMLMVAFLLSTTAALDKYFVGSGGNVEFAIRFSRSLVLALGKCVVLSLLFAGLVALRSGARKSSPKTAPEALTGLRWWGQVWGGVPGWLILAGVFEAVVLVLQLTALQFTVAALVISIKRSGILLACVIGWFLFKERGIVDRVIGSFVILSGVLIFFMTRPGPNGESLSGLGAAGIAGISLVLMSVALYWTRDWNRSNACDQEIVKAEAEA